MSFTRYDDNDVRMFFLFDIVKPIERKTKLSIETNVDFHPNR